MAPFEIEPRQLRGRRGRGPISQFSIAAFVFVPFGLALVGAAVALVLWEMRLLDVPRPEEVAAWMIFYAAALLALLGVGTVLLFLGDLMSFGRRWRAGDSQRPWLRDYHWNPRGHRVRVWSDISAALYLLVVLGALLPGLLLWASRAPVVYVGVIAAGLLGVLMLFLLMRELLRYFKFGSTWVRYHQFPYRPGEKVAITWGAQRGVNPFNRIHFILRYVAERRHERFRRGELQVEYKPYQLWAATYTIESGGQRMPSNEQTLVFDVPPGAPGTQLRANPPRYWELEVDIHAPGVNYQRTYPVPLYEQP